jgi:AraC family transcriptional regulator
MQSRIEVLIEKKLIGQSRTMSFLDNTTEVLWREFMPRRDEIHNRIGTAFYSVQLYAADFFSQFNPAAMFTKWAAVEVSDYDTVPAEMECLTIADGLYAVFEYKGDARNAAEIYQYIFNTWLPQSGYILDTRLHFEILGEKYKKNDPDSEEEIWIPIRQR